MLKDLQMVAVLMLLACIIVSIPYTLLVLVLKISILETSLILYSLLGCISILIKIIGKN